MHFILNFVVYSLRLGDLYFMVIMLLFKHIKFYQFFLLSFEMIISSHLMLIIHRLAVHSQCEQGT